MTGFDFEVGNNNRSRLTLILACFQPPRSLDGGGMQPHSTLPIYPTSGGFGVYLGGLVCLRHRHVTVSCRHVHRLLPAEMYPRVLHACCDTYTIQIRAQPARRRLQRVQRWCCGITCGVQ